MHTSPNPKRHLFTLVNLLQNDRVLCSLKHPWGQKRYDRLDFRKHTSKTPCIFASVEKCRSKKSNIIIHKNRTKYNKIEKTNYKDIRWGFMLIKIYLIILFTVLYLALALPDIEDKVLS